MAGNVGDPPGAKEERYNVGDDPLERKNLYAEDSQKARVAAMREFLREAPAKLPGTFAELKSASKTKSNENKP